MIRALLPRSLRLAPVLAAVLVGALALTARAEAPEADDMPTLERIYQEAKAAKEEAERAAAEAARDPNKEAIEAYRDGRTALAEFKPLTDIINNDDDDEIQRYRQPAATAILQRFRQENGDDPAVQRTRAALALEIVDLMKANSSDQVGLAIIQEVLQTWWRAKMTNDVRFKATDKWRERSKAWRIMRRYLQEGR